MEFEISDDDELDGPKVFTRFRVRLATRSVSGWNDPPEMSPEQREKRIEILANRADKCLNLFDTNDETVYSLFEKTWDETVYSPAFRLSHNRPSNLETP
jgi:hypothetical protein